MKEEDKKKFLDLRCRSKRGEYLPPDTGKFMDEMRSNWPVECNELEAEVFERTKPFGA